MSFVEDSEEPLASFPIPLDPLGRGNELRTQNTSPEDWERHNVIERTQNAVHIYCDLIDVRHGTMGPAANSELATLMVFRFRFDPQKHSRRIYSAAVKIEFISANAREDGPEVVSIAPEERWNLANTSDHQENVYSGELNLGASGVPFVTAGGTLGMERTTTRDITAATTVTGTTNLGTGRNSGLQTVASWRLLENKVYKTGVPDSVRVALLLKRESAERFNAIVTMEADADLATSFGSLFRRVPLDDPVLFNPAAEPSRPRRDRLYEIENLGDVDLYTLCDARIAGRRFCYAASDRPPSFQTNQGGRSSAEEQRAG